MEVSTFIPYFVLKGLYSEFMLEEVIEPCIGPELSRRESGRVDDGGGFEGGVEV